MNEVSQIIKIIKETDTNKPREEIKAAIKQVFNLDDVTADFLMKVAGK